MIETLLPWAIAVIAIIAAAIYSFTGKVKEKQ